MIGIVFLFHHDFLNMLDNCFLDFCYNVLAVTELGFWLIDNRPKQVLLYANLCLSFLNERICLSMFASMNFVDKVLQGGLVSE